MHLLYHDFEAFCNLYCMAINIPNFLLPTDNTTSANTTGSNLPWGSSELDKYFPFLNIAPERWNQLFPYRLLVYDIEKEEIVRSSGNSGTNPKIQAKNQNDSLSISVEFSDNWVCTLPITPQQFSITDIFAITNTPTLRGILEEHNGVKYKQITMSGSTGVYPARQAFASTNQSPKTFIESIFTGTTNAFGNLSNSFNALRNLATSSKGPAKTPVSYDQNQTGYYHAHYVQQFLEQYAIAKKNPDNKAWRLVLDIPKDNTSYFVTPVSFSLTKSVQKPMEHQYAIQFKAWKRVDLNNKVISTKPNVPGLNTNDYQKIIDATVAMRQVVQDSYNTIRAVRSDILTVANDARQFTIFVKDIANISYTAADLPNQIIKDLQDTFTSGYLDLKNANINFTAADQKIVNQINQLADLNEGAKQNTTPNNSQLQAYIKTSPVNNVFNDPAKNFSFFNAMNIDQVEMTTQQSQTFENEVDKVRNFTVQDLKDKRQTLYSLALDLSNQFGANDPTINKILNRPTPNARPYPFSIEENTILNAIYNMVQAYDNITSTRFVDENKKLSPLKYTGDLARANNIPFNDQSTAKILVPVPYNSTIEEIAQRYLKDSSRWMEISTLNYLREPYIDESGFTLNLLSNGDARQFTVNSKANLFLGQKISLASTTVPMFSRTIIGIQTLTEFSFLITVDGEADLSSLTTTDKAYMKAYLPGTVNSQDFIYIPTNEPVDTETYPTLIPGLKQDALVGLAKVDFLLTDNMDVALDGNGDFRISSGITNLIQALKIKFSVEKGTWLAHPDFGIGVGVGSSAADVNATELFKDIQNVVLADGRFSGIQNLKVDIKPPTVTISLEVTVRQTKGIVPISFTIDV